MKEGPPMANARPCLVACDPRVSKSLQIRGIPMKGKKWKELLETVGDSLQDQKSDNLKRVDRGMLQVLSETVGARRNSESKLIR